jgi:hypothetical protein
LAPRPRTSAIRQLDFLTLIADAAKLNLRVTEHVTGRGLGHVHHHIREAKVKPPAASKDGKFAWILIGIVALAVLATQCSKSDESLTSTLTSAKDDLNLAAAEEELKPVVLFPLDASAVQRGAAQLRIIAASDIEGGAKIFSENCFEAVSTSFNSHQLDRCGGFDMMVVRSIESNESAFTPAELEYFQPETAAGRYLGPLTNAGEEAEKADLRLASLSQLAAKARLPKLAVSPPSDESASDLDSDGEAVVGDTDAEDSDESASEDVDI